MSDPLPKDRKYKGDRLCEAIVGQDPRSRQPHLIKCGQPAEWVYFGPQCTLGALLCGACYARIKARDGGADGD